MEWLPEGTVLSVPGWRGAAVAAGLKPSRALDVAVLVADGDRAAAGVFTRNRLPAAPVLLCRERLAAQPSARAIVVNAGNANAMTGASGVATARAMAERVEASCGAPALVLSTGVIGVQLPREPVLAGIAAAVERLTAGADAGRDVARAMLTTDTRIKTTAVRVRLPATSGAPETVVTVGGVAKGSGMIHPDMATMLSIVTTDAVVEPKTLDALLRRAVDRSFHEITVDGDTSTNDSVLLLAGGGEGPPIGEGDPRLAPLEAAVTELMRRLAWEIVHDGEGVSRVLDLRVTGARSKAEARRVAETVARSPLVKTAVAGGDPNWGRILAAAANAGVPIDIVRLTLKLGGLPVFAGGAPSPVDAEALDRTFRADDVTAELDLGLGEGAARMLAGDLTAEYVRINAEYTT